MDVALRMKKAREELTKFQSTVHTKKLEREKLQEEIQEDEARVREIRTIERDLRLKRSRLGRLDGDVNRLDREMVRLSREIPNMAGELRRMGQGGRFRRPL